MTSSWKPEGVGKLNPEFYSGLLDTQLSPIPDKKKYSFLDEFGIKPTEPSEIYGKVISDSNGTLVDNIVVYREVEQLYRPTLLDNLTSIYDNSAKYFMKIVENVNSIVSYEKFIFLLTYIVYVYGHREDLRGRLENDAVPIIDWVTRRYTSDLRQILNGPKSNIALAYDYELLYRILMDNSIIASHDIVSYKHTTRLDEIFSHLSTVESDARQRPNSYSKVVDEARQYTIQATEVIDLKMIDRVLYFDLSRLSIGEVNLDKKVNNVDKLEVTLSRGINGSSHVVPAQFELLMRQFSILQLREFTFPTRLFKSKLDDGRIRYLVFPGVTTEQRTIHDLKSRGALRIGGRFVRIYDREPIYRFLPIVDKFSYVGIKTHVTSLEFYIEDAIPILPSVDVKENRVYNRLESLFNNGGTNDLDGMNILVTKIIDESCPMELLSQQDLDDFLAWTRKLMFVPADIQTRIPLINLATPQETYMSIVRELRVINSFLDSHFELGENVFGFTDEIRAKHAVMQSTTAENAINMIMELRKHLTPIEMDRRNMDLHAEVRKFLYDETRKTLTWIRQSMTSSHDFSKLPVRDLTIVNVNNEGEITQYLVSKNLGLVIGETNMVLKQIARNNLPEKPGDSLRGPIGFPDGMVDYYSTYYSMAMADRLDGTTQPLPGVRFIVPDPNKRVYVNGTLYEGTENVILKPGVVVFSSEHMTIYGDEEQTDYLDLTEITQSSFAEAPSSLVQNTGISAIYDTRHPKFVLNVLADGLVTSPCIESLEEVSTMMNFGKYILLDKKLRNATNFIITIK